MDRIDPIQGFCEGYTKWGGRDYSTSWFAVIQNEFLSQKLTQFQAAFTLYILAKYFQLFGPYSYGHLSVIRCYKYL